MYCMAVELLVDSELTLLATAPPNTGSCPFTLASTTLHPGFLLAEGSTTAPPTPPPPPICVVNGVTDVDVDVVVVMDEALLEGTFTPLSVIFCWETPALTIWFCGVLY